MDITEGFVIAIIVFALVVGVILLLNRGKAKVKIWNNLGSIEASNQVNLREYAIKIENSSSVEGGLSADDSTGQGASLKDVIVKKDIQISVSDNAKKKDP